MTRYKCLNWLYCQFLQGRQYSWKQLANLTWLANLELSLGQLIPSLSSIFLNIIKHFIIVWQFLSLLESLNNYKLRPFEYLSTHLFEDREYRKTTQVREPFIKTSQIQHYRKGFQLFYVGSVGCGWGTANKFRGKK